MLPAVEGSSVCERLTSQAIIVTGTDDDDATVLDLRHSKGIDSLARKQLLDRVMETQDMDNEALLQKLKARLDR